MTTLREYRRNHLKKKIAKLLWDVMGDRFDKSPDYSNAVYENFLTVSDEILTLLEIEKERTERFF